MAYDVPPPKELPEPGYYYHFKHDPNGPVNNYAYYIYGVAITLKMIAGPKTLLFKYIARYTKSHMPTVTVGCSTFVPCTCFTNRPSGREKRCRGSRASSTTT